MELFTFSHLRLDSLLVVWDGVGGVYASPHLKQTNKQFVSSLGWCGRAEQAQAAANG